MEELLASEADALMAEAASDPSKMKILLSMLEDAPGPEIGDGGSLEKQTASAPGIAGISDGEPTIVNRSASKQSSKNSRERKRR